ncbi:MAG: ATP-binding protein [Spirochaetales bacterium]|nr:ATP-binding protein [Spirochaetales bacterium]
MKNVILVGFSENDFSLLEMYLAEKQFSVRDLRENLAESLSKMKDPMIVFFSVQSEEDSKLLRKIITDYPQHLYGCTVPENNRDLGYAVSLLPGVQLFFLPLVKKEVQKVASKLYDAVRSINRILSVYEGLVDQHHHFRWKTRDLQISETCRFFATILMQAGMYQDDTQMDQVVLALEEALINSVEHGNLELDSSLRPQSLFEEDRYEEERVKRLGEEQYGGRYIDITLNITRESAELAITNQGPGFDTSNIKIFDEDTSEEEILDISGKGGRLISRAFDETRYNRKGTKITLIRRAPVRGDIKQS